MKRIVLFGCPRPIGGANTEAGDTALLWRKMGIAVDVLPAEEEDPSNPWLERLDAYGCRIMPPCEYDRPPKWLFDSIVVDFDIERCVRHWDAMAKRGCRLIHVPCMTSMARHEENAFRHRPPTAVVFQSAYQRNQLAIQYTVMGVPAERQAIIHGAFDPTPFPFAPRRHMPDEPFAVGRLARDVSTKWPKRLWTIMEAARLAVPLKGDVMGWTPAVASVSGNPPEWVHCRPPGSFTSQEYLFWLHAMLCIGNCPENWPRVGLEAMSAGVPIITDGTGGWLEMVDSSTAIIAHNSFDAASAIVALASDETARMQLVENANRRLAVLTDESTIGGAWLRLLLSV